MVEWYFIDEWQHDSLIRSARYGKDCQVLDEADRIMCGISEDVLNLVSVEVQDQDLHFYGFKREG